MRFINVSAAVRSDCVVRTRHESDVSFSYSVCQVQEIVNIDEWGPMRGQYWCRRDQCLLPLIILQHRKLQVKHIHHTCDGLVKDEVILWFDVRVMLQDAFPRDSKSIVEGNLSEVREQQTVKETEDWRSKVSSLINNKCIYSHVWHKTHDPLY